MSPLPVAPLFSGLLSTGPLFSSEGPPLDSDDQAARTNDPGGSTGLAAFAERVNRALARSLERHVDTDGSKPAWRLREAMRYALLGGGKRLRPALVIEAARAAAGISLEAALELASPAAVAVEYVHTYSLIHDDLPALDNDTLRRGLPTLHLAFDEATALLAGDALLTDAFGIVSRAQHRAAEQVLELSLAAGSAGMVSGQIDDLDNEGLAQADVDLAAIHRRKTGRLFQACCVLGGLAVDAPFEKIDALRRYGAALGLAFQIADDVIDASSSAEVAGKHVGRDAEREKVTYASRYGVPVARAMAQAAAERAVSEASRLGPSAQRLEDLARFAAHRRS
jgi:geranylgeranyl diphosphate synthase, type II